VILITYGDIVKEIVKLIRDVIDAVASGVALEEID